MNHDAYPDSYIHEIRNNVKSIAMVGASPVNVRPSYFAFKYLAQRGYDFRGRSGPRQNEGTDLLLDCRGGLHRF